MISIVTAYYNRKSLFIKSLKSFTKSVHKDYEIIAVDDGSSESERLEDLLEKYPNLKIIRIEPEQKTWVNPCVCFNMGFNQATGDIVVIQNPECLHYGDVLDYVSTIQHNQYFSFACYSLDKKTTEDFNEVKIFDRSVTKDGDLAWYNHSIYRPKGYHFCSAITKRTLNKINGFDEKYSQGFGYDDDDLVFRIKKHKLEFRFVDEPFVMHQWHQNFNYAHPNADRLFTKNREIFQETIN